jgi:H+/gluconate symporter-like permease
VLIICIVLIIGLITVLRMHAFLALIVAAMAAGLLAQVGALPGEPEKSHWVQAIELTTAEFGVTAGKIGVVIALASVIGMCLMESGAADKVVRRFLALFGEKRAGAALMVSSYILSIPIFFDTFFMLLLPIAQAMCLRMGKNYLLYVMAICCAGSVTHSMVAPHPGPLAMAETLGIDLGLTIIAGILAGILPATASWFVARWLNRRMAIPLRDTPVTPLADLQAVVAKREDELPSFTWSILPVILPILLISLASVFVAVQGKGFRGTDLQNPSALVAKLRDEHHPVSRYLWSKFSESGRKKLADDPPGQPISGAAQRALLDELNKALKGPGLGEEQRFKGLELRDQTRRLLAQHPQGENLTRLNRSLIEDTYAGELRPSQGIHPSLHRWIEFIGNRNIALFLGAVIAMAVLARQKGYSVARICELIGPPFETAGVIILITSAGGAFGLMLKNAGVGEAIKAIASGYQINNLLLILLSYLVACVIRIAQGSATVAMLTTAGIMLPILNSGAGLPYHSVYIFLAIGFGAMILSWMNDSGFWVVSKLSGFTEKETLKSWTVVVTVNSVAGLIVTLVAAWLFPFK